MNGLLVPLVMPLMQFPEKSGQALFVSTGICSPAYFSAWITPNHLAAC